MSLKLTDESEPKGADRGRTGAPGQRRWVLVGLGLVVAALLFFWLAIRRPDAGVSAEAPVVKKAGGTVKFLMEQQWLIRMKLAKVAEEEVARQITSTGRIIPAANKQALVSPPVGGILAAGPMPRVGQRVAQGQVLAVIRQTATAAEAAQVRAAQAQVQAQNAQVSVENARLDAERRAAAGDAETARVRYELAQKEAERARRLYEREAVSQRQMQAAEAEREAAKAAYEAALQRRDALASAEKVAPAKADVGGAGTSHTVRAPLSGFVTRVHKSIGEQVMPGESIVEISNPDVVWVEAPIFELDLARLGNHATATFTTAAYPDQEFTGKVLDLGVVIDEKTRAATVTFEVPNSGRLLRIGMQANIRLDAAASVQAMMIPKEAVLDHEGKKIVYVLVSGEEFQRREVALGDEYGSNVAVLSGLAAGERVVTQGAYQLKLQELRPSDAGAHTHET